MPAEPFGEPLRRFADQEVVIGQRRRRPRALGAQGGTVEESQRVR